MASNCQIPTPQKYVQQMLDYVDYSKKLYGKKVLENSCGEGNILLEVVKRYIESAKSEKHSAEEIKNGLNKDIEAYEIDKECIEKCKNRLNKLAASYGIEGIEWNIKNNDFLKEDVQNRYDFIIGNPPYITYHDMDDSQREFLKKSFSTCNNGRFDYCYAFIEASLKTLKNRGKMVYLVPCSIMTNKFAGDLRVKLSKYITEIYDYRTIKIFSQALTSSVIIVCENLTNKSDLKYHLVKENTIFEIERKKLTDAKWSVTTDDNNIGVKFSDFFEVKNSVATLLNEAFIFKEYERRDDYYIIDEYKIEEELVKDAASIKSLSRGENSYKIIFPYRIEDGKRKDYSESEFEDRFPGAVRYLKQFKDKLKKRKKDKNTLWFQYGRSQAITSVTGNKLIIPMVITKEVHVYEVGENAVPYAGYFIKCRENSRLGLQDAKKILESKDFYDYVKICGTPTTATSYRISVNDIKKYKINI
ncbi:Eco57I restriction-modification methylase domain-containing protein [Anaerostipes sp. Marseille-Q3525]|uniref:Eco57I restriction-modification methylase domain-containing protein n=1 Tax=Anaerostipes sp. Marseille-Q3525 TaxID=2758418 RepID=UPI001BADB863|nr:N-6 DNA methylase [Anaerostipes sp. Marseille-Q3525]MBR9961108.1 SAM-dependent methyltransferase [Anaerostipes sp. Marseille-Q3525]